MNSSAHSGQEWVVAGAWPCLGNDGELIVQWRVNCGPMESMIIPVFSKNLNGYQGVMARMTSTGRGKDDQCHRRRRCVERPLDAHRLPDAAAKRFTNDAPATGRWLKPLTVDRIVFEATGRYTHKLELGSLHESDQIVRDLRTEMELTLQEATASFAMV
jgi:hypothetical protein